ncbi:MAG: hypothetical protein EU530_05370 [Promethearchaeota archaeon]|nr:MAG: hypothetical protein EU530_05370 [Candidatus Lokiarchaeota archaeon]
METSKASKPKSFTSRFFMVIGLSLLFCAIFLVYLYSGLRMVYNWAEYNSGPGDWLDHVKIEQFFHDIEYDEIYRMKFILIIVGVFMLSLVSMLIHNKFVKNKDAKDVNRIIIIHDDIIQVQPEIDDEGKEVYHPEKFVPQDGFYTMTTLYKRKGAWSIILKISNYLVILAILAIIWTFYRSSALAFDAVYYATYLYTDEAYIIITSSVTFLLVYYLLRCPDFVKSLAATGFKRIYVKKIHLHETFLGILLTIGGILFVMNGEFEWGFLDRAVGLCFVLLGVFMIGRDWKDFVMGKFLRD